VFADGLPWQSINSSSNSFELSCGNESTEHNGWQFLQRKIPGTQQRPFPGKFQDSLLMC
jgi:hypothetical protein